MSNLEYKYGQSAFGMHCGVYLSKRWSEGVNLREGVEDRNLRPIRCALILGGVKREGVRARPAASARCRKVRGAWWGKTKRDIVADGRSITRRLLTTLMVSIGPSSSTLFLANSQSQNAYSNQVFCCRLV